MQINLCRLKPYIKTIEVQELTQRELEYIENIEQYKYENRKVPTIRKISEFMGLSSPSTVKNMLDTLKKKGYNYKEV